MKRQARYLIIFAVAAVGAGTGSWRVSRTPSAPEGAAAPNQPPASAVDASATATELRALLDAYRKIIVLTHDDAKLPAAERNEANRIGQQLLHENQERIARIESQLTTLVASTSPRRFDAIGILLDYVESDEGLYDADRRRFAK